ADLREERRQHQLQQDPGGLVALGRGGRSGRDRRRPRGRHGESLAVVRTSGSSAVGNASTGSDSTLLTLLRTRALPTIHVSFAAVAAVSITIAAPRASAQAPAAETQIGSVGQIASPADARFHVGPLGITPTITLSNFGIDNNVFNDADHPQQDTT